VVGARWDHDRIFGGIVSPRLGVILKSRIGTSKLLYGRSFRAPTLYELYYDDSGGTCDDGDVQANPDLRPEKAYTYEVVHETEVGRLAHLTVSAFYYKISGLINEVEREGGCLTSVNAGVFRSKGVEAELRGRLPGELRWSLDYAVTDSRNDVTGERAPVSPEDLGNARLVIPLLKPGATLGLSTRFIGERLTKSGEELRPALVTDATLHIKRIIRGLSLSLSAKNLFNVEHLEPAGPEHLQETLPQDKRVFMIRATWEL
jgi:outer membrane receptor protein involved in Fe transport